MAIMGNVQFELKDKTFDLDTLRHKITVTNGNVYINTFINCKAVWHTVIVLNLNVTTVIVLI